MFFPQYRSEEIVFECGGRLYLLNLETEKYTEASIRVLTDRATLKAGSRMSPVLFMSRTYHQLGKRAVFEARGEVFHGSCRATVSCGI